MAIERVLAISANALALLILGWKTWYDLVYNKKVFHQERLAGLDSLEAAKRKRERSNTSTAITFGALAISYLIFIILEVT